MFNKRNLKTVIIASKSDSFIKDIFIMTIFFLVPNGKDF